MKRFVAAAAASATIFSATAALAGSYEEPVIVTPTPIPAPVISWSGPFAGISVGGSNGTYDLGVSDEDQEGPPVDVDGVVWAVRGGYNWQNNQAVYGLDVSIGNGPDGITEQGTAGPFWSCNTGDCNVDIQTLASIRGRAGYLVAPASLLYVAGGAAYAKYEGGIENSAQQGDTENNWGYTVGLGFEHKFNQRVSAYAEVNHYDLGDLDFGTGIGSDQFDGVGHFNTAIIGLNIHF